VLRIAIPNKGSLSETAVQLLAEAGYATRRDSKTLHLIDEANGVEFFYLRPRDIATYVARGALDVGLTGRDLLRDVRLPQAREVEALGFGRSTFRFAAPAGAFSSIEQLDGKRVATSYAGLVEEFLGGQGITVDVVPLNGAVESAPQLGVADAIADVVEIFGPVMLESEAVLIQGPGSAEGIDKLLRRLRGVLVARRHVMLDYDLPADLVDQASLVAEGMQSPTVSPLQREGWVAVRVMVPKRDANRIMDDLYSLGARALIVTAIDNARL
jgi:ATP phosphoribosyltransferase